MMTRDEATDLTEMIELVGTVDPIFEKIKEFLGSTAETIIENQALRVENAKLKEKITELEKKNSDLGWAVNYEREMAPTYAIRDEYPMG